MKIWLLFPILVLISCSDSNFRKVEQLDTFRVLGIEASLPEVAPNTAVNLRLFVSDPNGPTGGREIVGQLESCIDPGISLGAPVSCDHDPSRITSPFTIDTRLADFQNNLSSGFSPFVVVTVPATILLGRTLREENNGVGYISIFTFTVDGVQVRAFKRILASNRAAKNTNPTGSAIELNGLLFVGHPQKGDRFHFTTSAPESYTFVNVDGSSGMIEEEMSVAWYITASEFDKPKVDLDEEVELTETPPLAPYLIVGIVRDDRGGLSVVRIKVP